MSLKRRARALGGYAAIDGGQAAGDEGKPCRWPAVARLATSMGRTSRPARWRSPCSDGRRLLPIAPPTTSPWRSLRLEARRLEFVAMSHTSLSGCDSHSGISQSGSVYAIVRSALPPTTQSTETRRRHFQPTDPFGILHLADQVVLDSPSTKSSLHAVHLRVELLLPVPFLQAGVDALITAHHPFQPPAAPPIDKPTPPR